MKTFLVPSSATEKQTKLSFINILYYYHCLIALAQVVPLANVFLMGGLQQVAQGQEDAFTLHV